MKQLHFLISGRVQGVLFRYTTHEKASSLGLTGYVRNLPNGIVEVLAQGEERALKQLEAWLQHGPSHAQVENCETKWETPKENFNSFEICF